MKKLVYTCMVFAIAMGLASEGHLLASPVPDCGRRNGHFRHDLPEAPSPQAVLQIFQVRQSPWTICLS